MHILSIIGARPQFVKLAPLSRALRARHRETIVHTGQHFDHNMSALFFEELGIPEPDEDLGISGGGHGVQTGRMLEALEQSIERHRPDGVVVFGDTNSTLAGALAAVKLHVPVVHVEAGLRSFNREMPEEINRILTDHAGDLLFAPTPAAMEHLEREGLGERSHLTGDLMVDGVLESAERAAAHSTAVEDMGLDDGDFILVTLHRPYNVDDPERLQRILDGLGQLGMPVVFPIHPRTQGVVEANGLQVPDSIRIVDPLGHMDFVRLMAAASRMITDSGGIQKEAYVLRTPCLTMRTETEWVETVEVGWNRLVDPAAEDFADIVAAFVPPEAHPDLYGTGVAETMVRLMEQRM